MISETVHVPIVGLSHLGEQSSIAVVRAQKGVEVFHIQRGEPKSLIPLFDHMNTVSAETPTIEIISPRSLLRWNLD